MSQQEPQKTPLYEQHVSLGGKIVDFAGWSLPVQYEGLIKEHRWVRENAGIFDVSHMGEIEVTCLDGSGVACEFLDFVTCSLISKLTIGKARYTALLNNSGGVIDDIIVYRLTDNGYLLCVNASNTDACFEWLQACAKAFLPDTDSKLAIMNRSAEFAQLAIQGPKAREVLSRFDWIEKSVLELKPFKFVQQSFKVSNIDEDKLIIACTGYTGEDGFEIFLPARLATSIWKELLTDERVKPIGLGARDSLRLEAGYPLHGNDLSPEVAAIESGLGWTIKWSKKSFIGKDSLLKLRESGVHKKLVGFKIVGKGIARHDYVVCNSSGDEIGVVTSGTKSPLTGSSIGLARVDNSYSKLDTEIFIKIRDRLSAAMVVKPPFFEKK